MLNLFSEVNVEKYPKTVKVLGLIGIGGLVVTGICGTAIACQNALMTRESIRISDAICATGECVADVTETIVDAVEGIGNAIA